MLTNPRKSPTYLVQSLAAKHTMAEGIGCNFLLTNQSALPPAAEKAKWRQIMRALDDLQMGWMRVGVIPTAGDGAWDEKRMAWDFSHPHFQTLKVLGRWAEKRGVRLMFDPFSVPESFRPKGAFFADDPRDYATRLMLPIAQFFRKNKLTAYRYFGLLNERIWGPDKEGFAGVPEFYALYKAVRDILDENGFPADVLGLLGPSNLSSWEWPISDFFACGLDPDPLWIGYDQHLYLYHFDWSPENDRDFTSLAELTEGCLRRYADYAHKRNKPFFLTELGNFYCGRLFWGERDFNGPASHTSLLLDAELIVRSLNEGVDGFLRWAFCVTPGHDGRWSFVENLPDGMRASPETYSMYRLLMHAVRPGATILQTHVQAAIAGFRYVFSAAVQNKDGDASLLLINDLPGRNIDVGLQLGKPFKNCTLHRTVWDETRKGESLPPIVMPRSGEQKLMLTPSSLTVLSLRPIAPSTISA